MGVHALHNILLSVSVCNPTLEERGSGVTHLRASRRSYTYRREGWTVMSHTSLIPRPPSPSV